MTHYCLLPTLPMINIQNETPLEKTNVFFAGRWLLRTDTCLAVWSLVYFCLSALRPSLLEAVEALILLPQSVRFYMYSSSVVSRKQYFYSYNLSASYLSHLSESWEEEFDEGILFRIDCLQVCHSAHCLVIDFHVNSSFSTRGIFSDDS